MSSSWLSLHAFDIVPEGNPFDVEDRDAGPERAVRQHETRDILGRSDEVALAAEACLEFLAEALEQVNVLGFLAGKLKQRAHAVVVAGKLRTGMIDHVRQE